MFRHTVTLTLFLLFDIELLIFSILNLLYPETFPLFRTSMFSFPGLGSKAKGKEVILTQKQEELKRTLDNITIPTNSFITMSYLLSIFWFVAIVASIPIIVCLVNHSPEAQHHNKHEPITHPDYNVSGNTNKAIMSGTTSGGNTGHRGS